MVQMIIQQILEQHAGSVSRSTALQPVLYFEAIVGAALVGVSQTGGPPWIIYALLIVLVGVAALFAWAYVYFMRKSPDALRSEKFNITKLAIERGLIGDKTLGNVLAGEDVRSLPLAPDDKAPK